MINNENLDLSGLNNSENELCKSPSDVIRSETAVKIVSIIVSKLDLSNQVIEAYKLFANGENLSSEQKQRLHEFLNMNEAKKLGEDILSKLSIKKSNEVIRKETGLTQEQFIDKFLKNPIGDFSLDNLIKYIVYKSN
nr:hypothetical protein [Candidatus Gracilibacteria bacterium]